MVCFRHTLLSIILGALLAACGAPDTAGPAITMPTARIALQPTHPTIAIASPSARLLPSATASPSPAPPPNATAIPTLTATTTISPALDANADPATLEALLVVEINKVRAANGLPPYLQNPELSAAARAHSCDMAVHRMISHISSDGRTLKERLAGGAPPWEWPSESIAAGIGDPAAIVALWMDEPPDGWHRRNILDADQRQVGAGDRFAADDPTGNHHYWTADFSRHSGS